MPGTNMKSPSVRAQSLKTFYSRYLRQKRLNDLKDLVRWFLEEERDKMRESESKVFNRLLEQQIFPGPAQDKELVQAILRIELGTSPTRPAILRR